MTSREIGTGPISEKNTDQISSTQEESLRLHFVPISPDVPGHTPPSRAESYERLVDFVPI